MDTLDQIRVGAVVAVSAALFLGVAIGIGLGAIVHRVNRRKIRVLQNNVYELSSEVLWLQDQNNSLRARQKNVRSVV